MSPRVAVFCRSFLPRSQTFVHDAVTRLTRYRATVFCTLREHSEQFPFDDVRVGGGFYNATLLSPSFARAFRRERFDVVHAHFGTMAIYALPYAELARLPLVVTFHGYDVPLLQTARRFGNAAAYAWLSGPMLRRMTLGLCASAELMQLLIAHGVPSEKLRVHALGIDTQRFVPAERAGPARVLMIGRLVEKKGFRYGLQAFARCPSATRLTLIGEGPLEAELRALAAELGIGERVEFTGSLPHAEVMERMKQHHILLAPCVIAANGDRDSGLIVLREAAACGLVPIASRMGGLPDSVDDGESGFLVEMRDVATLSDRLELLLGNAELRTRMGHASRAKMVRQFDHRITMPELERAYDDARARAVITRGRPSRAWRAGR